MKRIAWEDRLSNDMGLILRSDSVFDYQPDPKLGSQQLGSQLDPTRVPRDELNVRLTSRNPGGQ